MTEFTIAVEDAFNAAKDGRRDLTKWTKNCSTPTESHSLAIAVKFSGRYTHRVHLPRFELYGSSFELFKLGWIAWLLSIRQQEKIDYLIPLTCNSKSEFPFAAISCYRSEYERKRYFLTDNGRRPALILPAKVVTSSSISLGKYPPSFGIFDKNDLGYCDHLDVGGDCIKAAVLTASVLGLRMFAKSMMSFAVSEIDELYICHGGRGYRLGAFSYEANFYKHGSFGGDSAFLDWTQ